MIAAVTDWLQGLELRSLLRHVDVPINAPPTLWGFTANIFRKWTEHTDLQHLSRLLSESHPMELDHAQHSVVWFYVVPCLPYSMFKVTAKDAILPF